MPKVSVVIPTYNRAEILQKAIDSVLAQSYTDFEIIVVDDGSSDNTAKTVDFYGERVKYHCQRNSGVSAARNAGIGMSKGEYLSFLDSDDQWMKDKLKIQIDFMQGHRDIQTCYTNEIWIRNGIRVNQGKRHKKYSGWIFENTLPLCIISASSIMVRKGLFDEVGLFDENLPAAEDYDLWIRIAKDYYIHFIDQPLITKTGGHSDQLTKKYWGLDRFRVRALEKVLTTGNLSDERKELVVKHINEKARIYANGCMKRGRVVEAEKYFSILRKYEQVVEVK